jgi:hypothetical protein
MRQQELSTCRSYVRSPAGDYWELSGGVRRMRAAGSITRYQCQGEKLAFVGAGAPLRASFPSSGEPREQLGVYMNTRSYPRA